MRSGAGGVERHGTAAARPRFRVAGRSARVVLVPLLCLAGTALAVCASVLLRVRPAAITLGQRTVILQPTDDPMQHMNLLVHEAVHREQFRRIGLARFTFLYLTDLDSRLTWEAEAIAANLCRAREQGVYRMDALSEFYAGELRSYRPFGTLSQTRSRRYLDRAFRGGAACAMLMRRLITAAPELSTAPGIRAPHGAAAAP